MYIYNFETWYWNFLFKEWKQQQNHVNIARDEAQQHCILTVEAGRVCWLIGISWLVVVINGVEVNWTKIVTGVWSGWISHVMLVNLLYYPGNYYAWNGVWKLHSIDLWIG